MGGAITIELLRDKTNSSHLAIIKLGPFVHIHTKLTGVETRKTLTEHNMSKSLKSKKLAKDKTTSKVSQEASGTSTERKRTNEFACSSGSVSQDNGAQPRRKGMVGYIHGVSPPKLSKKNSEYSNFKFQSKSGVVPGVCFSSTKRSILAEREATKTAVKLERFNYAPDAKTIFVNDMTKISVPNSSEYDFQFVDNSIEQMDLLSITKNSTDMDLVNFVAKVIAKDVDD